MADNCSDLAAQIAALSAQIGRLNILTEAQVRQIVDNALNPKVTELTYKLDAASTDAQTANKTANTALQKVNGFQPGNYATIADLRLQRSSIDAEIQQFRQNIANGLATKAEKSAVDAYDAAMRGDIQRAESAASRAESAARNSQSSATSSAQDAAAATRAKEVADLKAKVAGNSATSSQNYSEVSAGASGESQKYSLTAEQQARIAAQNARNAINNATSAEQAASAAKGYRDSTANDASFVESLVDKTKTFVSEASGSAAASAKSALDANATATGIRGLVKGFGERLDGFGRSINALEASVGDAVKTAANAVGISNEALAATGRLASKVASAFILISQIFEIIQQFFILKTLGERIDAIESGLVALGQSVSGILGTLLGFKNRISRNEASITEVRGIAVDARGIGEAANLKAGSAIEQITGVKVIAVNAQSTASQAQTTANGAVRNAAIANSNATTAYQKATEAEGIGQQALRIGGEALAKAGEAAAAALSAIALYQTVKSLRGIPGQKGDKGDRGLQGLQGLQGIPGRDGRNGLDGAPGANGIPGTVGAEGRPGLPGLPGRNGINGINGKDGKDVNPADLAGLRALIVTQHAQTRANINGTTAGLFGKLQAFVAAGNTAITGLMTAIATNTYVEKALAVMTFAVTVHNALMLSNNLAQTLGTIINQCVALILPKGINGQPINITSVIGGAVNDVIKNVIGADNYTTISNDWAIANRIYQAGSNVFNQVSNAVGLLTSGLEMIGGNIGKIGNALKIWGVVGQKAYAFMNPQPSMKGKFFDFINTASADANTIQMMVAIPVGLAAAGVAINDSANAFAKTLDQTDPVDEHGQPLRNPDGSVKKYVPGLTIPDPTKTIAAQAQAQADSTNIVQATVDDIFNAND